MPDLWHRRAQQLLPLFLWLWPTFFVQWSVHEYVYYVPAEVLGLASLLTAFRALESASSVLWPALCGITGGLAWWTNPSVAVYGLPIVLVLVSRRAGRGKRLAFAMAGAILGASPWIVFNVNHRLSSLNAGHLATGAPYLHRLGNFEAAGVSTLFGFRGESGAYAVSWGHLGSRVTLLFFFFGVVVIIRWYGRRLTRSDGRTGPPPVDMIGLVLYPFVYAASSAVGGVTSYNPRYVFFGWPFAALAVGRLVVLVWRRNVIVPLVLVLVLGAVSLQQALRLPPHQPIRGAVIDAPYSYTTLARSLEQKHALTVFAGYWQAYLLDVAGGEAITATPYLESAARYKPYDNKVRASPTPVWLFLKGSQKLASFVSWLGGSGVRYASWSVSGFVVVQPARRVLPEEVLHGAIYNAKEDG